MDMKVYFSTVFGPSHLMVKSSSEELNLYLSRFQTLSLLWIKNIQITAVWF